MLTRMNKDEIISFSPPPRALLVLSWVRNHLKEPFLLVNDIIRNNLSLLCYCCSSCSSSPYSLFTLSVSLGHYSCATRRNLFQGDWTTVQEFGYLYFQHKNIAIGNLIFLMYKGEHNCQSSQSLDFLDYYIHQALRIVHPFPYGQVANLGFHWIGIFRFFLIGRLWIFGINPHFATPLYYPEWCIFPHIYQKKWILGSIHHSGSIVGLQNM